MNPIHHFWSWFTQNHHHFRNYLTLSPKLRKHYFFWLEWHLNFYCSGVTFVMVFPKTRTSKAKLIITANGREKLYEKVQEVVTLAPTIDKWKIIPFVQPTLDLNALADGTDKPFRFQDISMKASSLLYDAMQYRDSNKLLLTIYLEFEDLDDNYKDVHQAIYIILESLLGEKFLYKHIGHFNLETLDNVSVNDLLPLYTLQGFIETLEEY